MSDDHKENNEQTEHNASGKRKVSLAEAVKRKLEEKKNAQQGGKKQKHLEPGNQPVMKSQNTKKINNQRKRMGV